MKNALKIQNLLEAKGYKTLAAGGFVRDFLLGKIPKDIDLATSALPEEVIRVLEESKIQCIPTGLKHGTITAVLDKTYYEITTLRLDRICRGREAEVEFVKSFEEDAKRRDLTINALFMNLETQEIFDYCGGKQDLQDNVLKFVGDPEKRIREDYLRILRFYRFQSQLEFIPDSESLVACQKYLPFLCFVSSERIKDEMCKMIIGDAVQPLFLYNPDMVATVFPEIIPAQGFGQVCDYHSTDVYTHTLIGLNFLKQFKDPVLSVAHLFHDVSKPFCHSQQDGQDHFYGHEIAGEAVVDRAMSRLKFSNKEINRAKFIVRNHMRLHSNPSKKALRRLLLDCEEAGDRDFINDLYKVHVADIMGMRKQEIYPRENIDSILTEKPDAFKCPLTGTEIIGHFGLKEGSLIGKIKSYLQERVIEGSLQVDNKEEAVKLATQFMEDLCKE